MAETRTSEVVLRAKSDVSGFVQLRIESAKVRGEMQYLAQTAKQMDVATAQTGKSIRDAFSSQTTSRIEVLQGKIENTTTSTEGLTKALNEAAAAQDSLSGGGGGGFKTVSNIGRELKALPAVQIGGTGLSTDAVGKILQLGGKLPEIFGKIPPAVDAAAASIGTTRSGLLGGLAAAGVAGVGLSIILSKLAEDMARIDAVNKQGIANQTEYYKVISSGSRDTVQAAIAQIEQNQKGNQGLINSYKDIVKFTNDANAFDWTDKGVEATQKLNDALTSLGIPIDDFDVNYIINEITRLEGETTVGASHLADYKKVLADLNAEAERAALELARAQNSIKSDQSRISAQVEAANLAATGTEKQVQDRIDALAREKEVLQANLPLLQKEVEQATAGGEAQKALQGQVDQTRARLGELDTTMTTLAGDTLQAAKANDAAAQAEKDRKAAVDATAKYNQDIQKINADAAQKEIDLATKLADKQVDIARKAAEDAQDALTKLGQKLSDISNDTQRDLDKDVRKANFDSLQEQIKFQQNEVAQTTRHLNDLERIRRQAQEREFELGLDRDFAGLAQSRRSTANQINESNIQFNEDRQARLEAFRQKQKDDAAQFVFERQERIIKFEQDAADANLAYAREQQQRQINQNRALAQAQAAYNNDLRLLNQKHTAELTQRNNEIRAELQMIAQGTAGKLALEAQYWAQSRALIQGIFSNGGSTASGAGSGSTGSGRGNVLTRAGGGFLGVGQTSTVNEPFSSGRESFSNSRGTIPLPGYGLFTPLQGGNVNAGGGMNVYLSIDARGRDEQFIENIADRAITKYHIQMYGKKT